MSALCPCEDGGLFAALREDLDRHAFVFQDATGRPGAPRELSAVVVALLQRGFWAVLAYRVRHHARYRLHSRLLNIFSAIFHMATVIITSIEIVPDAHIGPGLWIPHGGYIAIGPVRIGRHCEIFQGVTLGARESTVPRAEAAGEDAGPTLPTLGDRVWVGPGAVIAGRITVGDDAAVGANSLVVRDVPPRGLMVGVPARLVSRYGSFAQITYRGMDEDAERAAALAAGPEAVDPTVDPATTTLALGAERQRSGVAVDSRIRSELTEFIVTNFLFGDVARTPFDDDALVEGGLIDSTGVLELIEFLESHFGIWVTEDETVPGNLGSISALTQFVTAKRADHEPELEALQRGQ